MSAPPWFLAPPDRWSPTEVTLPEAESHHALRVMRVSPPDVITVVDGRGCVARCSATRVENDCLVAEILEMDQRRAPKPAVVVYQAVPKGTKADAIVERLAELGVAEVWVFESERAVARWDEAKIERLGSRWDAIAASAAKQSRNPFVLHARAGLSWNELVAKVRDEQLPVVLWEEASLPLRTALIKGADRVALVVGPEGGFTQAEADALAEAGAQLASLGPRIVRTENAALVAASALLFHYGAIG